MTKIRDFDPSGIGLRNGNFIGLPFSEDTARVVLLPVSWDVTVSYGEGTAMAPSAILEASLQLDLYDSDVKDAWKLGIFMQSPDQEIQGKSKKLRKKSTSYIRFLEEGGDPDKNPEMQKLLHEVNSGSEYLNKWLMIQSGKLLDAGKLVGVIGGDHSVPLGFVKALTEKYEDFGILHLDAHMDLRDSYEGFHYSHASIFYNVLKAKQVSKLVQVGIRDYCDEEIECVANEGERISVFFDLELKENRYNGKTWSAQCDEIVKELPELVYISFDVDCLDPKLCPATGTPVPGGLEFQEALFLLKKMVEGGRKIIGFDVCETGNSEWDANVAARLIYRLCNLAGRSNGLI